MALDLSRSKTFRVLSTVDLIFRFKLARLLVVGPPANEWTLLRDTDGERFVARRQGYDFSGEFSFQEKERSI